MSKVAVFVELEIRPEGWDEWFAMLRKHAVYTLANEPGALRFEVMPAMERNGAPIPNRAVIHELYVDAAAFAEHGKSPSLANLKAENPRFVVSMRSVFAAG